MTGRAEAPSQSDGWSDIEAFLSDVSELSKAPTTLDQFADVTLQRTVELLEAIAGSVWLANHAGEFRPLSESVSDAAPASLLSNRGVEHDRFLRETIELGRSRWEPIEGLDEELVRVAAPCRLDDQSYGVIEVVQRADIGERALSGNEKLLTLVGQLTESFHRHQREREFGQTEDLYQQRETFVRRIHAGLRLGPTAYRVVNEARHLVGCDRISLAVPRRGGFDVVAISGIDEIDPKSELVASMRSLAQVVATSGQWLQFRGDTDELPPQIQDAVLDFVDLAHASTVDVVPLDASDGETDSDTVGVLIFERYREELDDGFEDRVTTIASLSAGAIRNALEHETLPFLGVSQSIRRCTRAIETRRRRALVSLVGLVMLGVIFYFVPVEFFVRCDGRVVALSQRHLFAPMDAEVVELKCRPDQSVDDGQVLVRLRSRDLEIELERSLGESQTVEKKLLAIDLARLESVRDGGTERIPGQLAAEEQELRQRLESLAKQIDLLRQQQEQLTIRSPLDGYVMTWDPEGLLTNRPVQRGQRMLSVADLSGDYRVELDVPIRRTGHVTLASRSSEEPIAVQFSLVNGVSRVFHGEVKELAGRIDINDADDLSMRVSVAVPPGAVEWFRPGAKVRAKIDCGTRSLGFVWFHEIVDTIKQWILL
ncbi:MAG: HlyD family efflux transporter periplasmic adaptor subunit [Planctomycetota bacterium]